MSYTVEYNPELRDCYPMQPKGMAKFPIKVLSVITVLVVLYTLNTTGIFRLLIPGDPAVTAGAFSSMVDQVRNGERVSEAVFTFIKDIILGGMR